MTDSTAIATQAYCMKCKTKRDMQSPQAVWTRTGGPATRGQCAVCGTGLFRMGNTPAHASLPKPEVIAKPKRKPAKPKRKKKSKSRAKSKARSNGRRAVAPRNVGKLVIVESPAKARTIGGFLGKGYTVLSSVGHVRDLLKSRLSVDIANDFEPEYRVPNEKRATVRELAAAAAGADEIYLATDPDREGEAIAWHLVAAADMPIDRIKRVVFHEITDGAVESAFANPRDINMDLVDAQQARRILDRLVGYQVSPLLWKKVRSGLSAGRVQSVALRLVVEREKAIKAFNPVEYWTIDAELAKQADPAPPFKARLIKIGMDSVSFDAKKDKPPQLDSEATVKPHVDILNRSLFRVAGVKRGTRQSKPSAPFTTSSLQQAASSQRRMNAGRTMRIAQQLYEGIDIGMGKPVGLITYMRTDSVQVSSDAQRQARGYIKGKFGSGYMPKSPPKYKTRSKGAQEAHEAIRPTRVSRTPESMKAHLDSSQLAVYTLIWQRFVASQMAPARYDTLRIDIDAGLTEDDMPYRLRASGSKLKFRGHLAVTGRQNGGKDNAQDFPALTEGEWLDRRQILPERHETQPPPRYTEATLIRQLEEMGIGRPSTYAPTVGIIQARDYVTQEQRRLTPTRTGFVVCELLSEFFAEEMDYEFTRRMEEQLDAVSHGALQWRPMLGEFYAPFEQRLQNAQENMPSRQIIEKVGRGCPRCEEGDLLVKHSRYGKFIGCSRYPDCKHTERYLERTGNLCPTCGDEMGGEIVRQRSRKGRAFYGCSRYPDCDYTTWRLPKDLKPVA